MSQYYKDAEDLYKIYGYFLDRVLSDDKIGAKMSKAGIIIKFMYTDPDAEITIDLKNPPASRVITALFIWGLAILRRMCGQSSRPTIHIGSGSVSKTPLPASPKASSSRAAR